MDVIAYAEPYEERSGGHTGLAIASYRLLSAVSALNCMCQVPQLAACLQVPFSLQSAVSNR